MAVRANLMLGAILLASGAAEAAGTPTSIPVPGAPGVEMLMVPVPAGVNADTAVPQTIEEFGKAQGGIDQHAKPTQVNVGGTSMRIETVSFKKAPGIAFFFLTVPQGKGVCIASIPLAKTKTAAKPVGDACLKAQKS